MIGLPPGTKVFLAGQPIDLRAGFDGLAAKVQQIIGADPFGGHVFIFRSKRAIISKAGTGSQRPVLDLKGRYWISKAGTGSQRPVLDLKGRYWDGSGLCPFAKRLERHKFVWPPIVEPAPAKAGGTLTLTPAQLALLVEAMDWRRAIAPPTAPRPMLV
jgi:transposase